MLSLTVKPYGYITFARPALNDVQFTPAYLSSSSHISISPPSKLLFYTTLEYRLGPTALVAMSSGTLLSFKREVQLVAK